MILPFQPVTVPDMTQTKLSGYSSIQNENMPKYNDVRKYLEIAEKYSEGYSWAEDVSNANNQRVEILLKSGLRIPVYPETSENQQPLEVTETTKEVGENNIVFGNNSSEIESEYKQINYASEIYEFLIYQLTKDLYEKEEQLRTSLLDAQPKPKVVEPLLRDWFDATTEFIKTKEPINFVSKIRSPCGQFTNKNKCTFAPAISPISSLESCPSFLIIVPFLPTIIDF